MGALLASSIVSSGSFVTVVHLPKRLAMEAITARRQCPALQCSDDNPEPVEYNIETSEVKKQERKAKSAGPWRKGAQ